MRSSPAPQQSGQLGPSDPRLHVYTVKFKEAVYVLHAFQKKSKSGVATSRHDIDLVKERLRGAERLHRQTEESEADAKREGIQKRK